MTIHWTAYGLQLRCSFPLPGIGTRAPAPASPHEADLPKLQIDEIDAEQLLADWSGAGPAPRWTGLLGDGLELRVECGTAGDVRFRYGERALFLLTASGERLRCARLTPGRQWLQVLLCRILPNIALLRGYEALHASAIELPQGVVTIAAPPGTGKSTLAVELVRHGARLFCDDVVVLASLGGQVLAYPGTPHVNLAERELARIEPANIDGVWSVLPGERWVTLRASATRPRPVALVCLLQRTADDRGGCRRLGASPLTLGPYMLGLSNDPARERARFGLYADLVERAPLVRLSRGRHSTPGELAEQLIRALAAERAQSDERALAGGAVR
jgi:hypothetical protein